MKPFAHRRERDLPPLEEEALAAAERALTWASGPVRVAQSGRTMVCSLPTGVQIALRPHGEGHRLTVSESYEWHGWLLGLAASLTIGAGIAFLADALFMVFALLFLAACVAGGTLLGHLPRRRRVARALTSVESALRVRVRARPEVHQEQHEEEPAIRTLGRAVDE